MTGPAAPSDDGQAAAGSSKLEQLRASFQRKLDEPRLYKKLPGGDGALVAEYRVLSSKESKEALSADDEFGQNADILIRSLVALHRHDPEHSAANDRGLVPLDVWLETTTGALGFDNRLVEALGLALPDNKARTIARELFNGNEISLGAQAAELLAWMTNTTTEAFQDFPKGS
jgi:hypothetical protein